MLSGYFFFPLSFSGAGGPVIGRSAASFVFLALCESLLPDEFFFGFLSPIPTRYSTHYRKRD